MDKYAQNVLWPQTEAGDIRRCNLASDTAVNADPRPFHVFFLPYMEILPKRHHETVIYDSFLCMILHF